MSLQGFWADLKTTEFQALPTDLVTVLPIGAIEQHGPHLPLSVDRDLVQSVIERTMSQLTADQNVLILPTLSVTKSDEHDQYPGTLSLTAETLLAVLRDIGASVSNAGVSRLVLFNGHGGNNAVLEIIARDLRIKHQMIVSTCSWFGFAEVPEEMNDPLLAFDLHAGKLETSAMLAARPELVDMSAAQDFVPAMSGWKDSFQAIGLTGQPGKPGWIIEDLNEMGACGNAQAATVRNGEKLLNSAAEQFAIYLEEFSRFDHRGSHT